MKKRVLIIENDPLCVVLIRAKLKDKFDLTFVTTLQAGLQQLNAEKWSTVVVDLSLPDSPNKDHTLREVRAHRGEAMVVVLTGDTDPRTRDHMLRLGADGYAVKGKDDTAADLVWVIDHAKTPWRKKEKEKP